MSETGKEKRRFSSSYSSYFFILFFSVIFLSSLSEVEGRRKRRQFTLESINRRFDELDEQFKPFVNTDFGIKNITVINKNLVDLGLKAGVGFVLRMQNSQGLFREGYNLLTKQPEDGKLKGLVFRQLGILWSLVRVWAKDKNNTELRNGIEKGLDFFFNNSQVTPDGHAMYITWCPTNNSFGHIGAIGFIVSAIVDLIRPEDVHGTGGDPSLYDKYIHYLSKYLTFMIRMIDEHGNYFYHYNTTNGERIVPPPTTSTSTSQLFTQTLNKGDVHDGAHAAFSKAYSGKATSVCLMALIKVVKYIPEYEVVYDLLPDLEDNMFQFWIKSRSYSAARRAGFEEYYLISSRELFSFSMKKNRVLDIYKAATHSLSYALTYLRKNPLLTRNNVNQLEGLISCYHIAYALNLQNIKKALKHFLFFSYSNMVKYQIGFDYHTLNAGKDTFALGGCLNSFETPLVLTDTTQHQLHAYILAKRYGH